MILPFSLLIKKFQSKIWFILIVSFLMKIGAYFERFVIISTSTHRDFDSNGPIESSNNIWIEYLVMVLVQGFIIALVLIAIQKLYEHYKLSVINSD